MSLAQKLDQVDALVASIRADLGIKKELRVEASVYFARDGKPDFKPEYKKVTVIKKGEEAERFTEENFFDKLYDMSTMKKFVDGSEKRVVTSLDRKVWPLTKEGNMYKTVQELCHDFDLEVVRDGGKPNVYIIMKEEKEEKVEGRAAGGGGA